MAGTTLDIESIIHPDILATEIANKWMEWNSFRSKWIEEKKELRNYLYATSTKTTSNAILPWSNTTTTPKLTQISDNLHANYMDALFPNDNWLVWEGDSLEDNEIEKRRIIEQYVKNKALSSGLRETISQCLYDYIDYGNCFGEVIYVNESHHDPVLNEQVTTYAGAKVLRISPLDIVFNPTASHFTKTPKFTRYLKSVAELKKEVLVRPDLQFDTEVFNKAIKLRRELAAYRREDLNKVKAYSVDGFGTLSEYLGSGLVEIIEFEGDWYDDNTDTLYENRIITIMDRCHILRNIENPNWLGTDNKRHVGWRDRPDNLYAMGPLDNLVGMQYRLDHLENLKKERLKEAKRQQ